MDWVIELGDGLNGVKGDTLAHLVGGHFVHNTVFSEYIHASTPNTNASTITNPYAPGLRNRNSKNATPRSTHTVQGLNCTNFSTRAISKHDSACTNLFSCILITSPPPKKKRKVTSQEESAATSTSPLEIIMEGKEAEPVEAHPPGPDPLALAQRPPPSQDQRDPIKTYILP